MAGKLAQARARRRVEERLSAVSRRRVSCLECGFEYTLARSRHRVVQRQCCPGCGYVGWKPVAHDGRRLVSFGHPPREPPQLIPPGELLR